MCRQGPPATTPLPQEKRGDFLLPHKGKPTWGKKKSQTLIFFYPIQDFFYPMLIVFYPILVLYYPMFKHVVMCGVCLTVSPPC